MNTLNDVLDDAEQREIGDLQPIEAALQQYTTPEPDEMALLAALQPYLPQKPIDTPPQHLMRNWHYWRQLAQAQIGLVHGAFWWATVLLFALGFALIFTNADTVNLFALASPVIAVLGTAYIFHPEHRSLYEFELLSAVKPLQLLYIRLMLILVYNLVFMMAVLAVSLGMGADVIVWRLLLIWFAPMVGLTGIALYLSIRWRGFIGVIVSLGIWLMFLLVGWRDIIMTTTRPLMLWETLALVVTQSNGLLIAALLICLLGCVMLWQVGRIYPVKMPLRNMA